MTIGVPLVPGCESDARLFELYKSATVAPLDVTQGDLRVVWPRAVCFARIIRAKSVTYWFRNADAE